MPRRRPSLPPRRWQRESAGAAAAWHRHPPWSGAVTKTAPEQESDRPWRTSGESFLAHPARALWAAGGMLALVVLIAIARTGRTARPRPQLVRGDASPRDAVAHRSRARLQLARARARPCRDARARRTAPPPTASLARPRRVRRRRDPGAAAVRRSSRRWSIALARPMGSSTPSAPPSPQATPPTPARPVSRSSCSSPHPARAADGGGRSPASASSGWPGVAPTCKSTGSRTSLPAHPRQQHLAPRVRHRTAAHRRARDSAR